MSNIYSIRNSGYTEINTTHDQSLTRHTRESYGANPIRITMIIGVIMIYTRVGGSGACVLNHTHWKRSKQKQSAERGSYAPHEARAEWYSEWYSTLNICFALLRGKLLQNGSLRPRHDYRIQKILNLGKP